MPNFLRWQMILSARGAVFENVTFRLGSDGVSVHAIQPELPYSIFIPKILLLNVKRLQLNNEGFNLDESGLDADMAIMWNEVFTLVLAKDRVEKLASLQKQLIDLPLPIRHRLGSVGHAMTCLWSPAEVRANLISSRYIYIDGEYYLMPLIEFVNHSPSSKGFKVLSEGVGIDGSTTDEVLVNYSNGDGFHFFYTYFFPASVNAAFSMGLRFQFLGKQVELQRNYLNMDYDQSNGCPSPVFMVSDDKIILNSLLLGHKLKSLFVYRSFEKSFITAGFPSIHAYDFFTAVYKANVNWCIALLKDLQDVEGLAADWLRQTTYQHLALMAEH